VSPADGSVLPDDAVITVDVLTTQDFDLNRVQLFYRRQGTADYIPMDAVQFDPKEHIGDPAGVDAYFQSGNVGSWPIGNGNDNFKWKWDTRNLEDGIYDVLLRGTDIAGNASDTSVGFPIADPQFLVEREKMMLKRFSQEIC
jgi:hypothetical protein